MENKLSILVLSCDEYCDIWNDFFSLRDTFWPNTDMKWYLVTESINFSHPNVEVIHTGKGLNWTGRLRHAVNYVNTKYIGWYLEDFFITEKVDNSLIFQLVEKMDDENIDYINMSDVFYSLVKMPEKHEYYDKHLLIIPNHKKYGISTASALWRGSYLLDILGNDDKNAWEFEIDLCKKAISKEGFSGRIFCDDRMPFNVTKIPVVIQGKYNPKAIEYFARKGFRIHVGNRGLMSKKDVFVFEFNDAVRKILRDYPHLSKVIKWLAQNIFRIKFFT